MLARRFTIVCLLTTLFGIGFAIIVAEASRQPRHWDEARSGACFTTCGQFGR
ncbi:MAG: hypothetical protein J0I86_14650 [Mesorhizobium sp.]|jgi:hypothetical protein|nr:hypothetical protein [Mesorhizobium sp.]